jgi:hypothetical protein
VVPSSVETSATKRDTRVPWIILLSTSLPRKSVPRGAFQEGPDTAFLGSGYRGSFGDMTGAVTPTRIIRATINNAPAEAG